MKINDRVQTLIESICRKVLAGKWYADEWIKLHSHKKRKKILFTDEVQCINNNRICIFYFVVVDTLH